MDIIQKELEIVKERLGVGFVDPISGDVLKDFLLSGSKFIRSTLSILYLKSQGIEIKDDIYKILVAGEIIHSASLLHDDVVDEADTRRGKTTISKEFDSKIAILAGDYLLSKAIGELVELKDFFILEKFKFCTQMMAEAEIKQYFLREKTPCADEYIQICKGKTAGLFSVILESVAGLSGMDSEKAKSFGEIFGLCFQIKNDLNQESAAVDKINGVITANDVLGIEKTQNLLDNYKEEMRKIIKDFPENLYKKGLEGLIFSI